MLPAAGQMTICFAHVAYQMQARFALAQLYDRANQAGASSNATPR